VDARLVSLNVGKPRPLVQGNKSLPSAIFKSPVLGPLQLGSTGLESDAQADLKNHGGVEKAVCVYPLEHYSYWKVRLKKDLKPGAFGENLSTEKLLEAEVCIGDSYRVGNATVQVTQPRQPCSKLTALHGVKELALWAQETGFTGFYLRCLEAGEIRAGDDIVLLERPTRSVSIAEANRVLHRDKYDAVGIERLLNIPELSISWRRTLEKRLYGRAENRVLRLEG
jgi:MOSC domain-containing protein YiiM